MRLLMLASALFSCVASAAEVQVESRFNFSQTVERYTDALKTAGIEVLSAENRLLPVSLMREEVIVFQNPYYGTSIGACRKGSRKDIPLYARVWTDNAGKVRLSYELPEPIVNSFGVIECGNEMEKLRVTLGGFAFAATE